MDRNILQYRKKHPKCKWCKYYEYHCGEAAFDFYSYSTCKLKDKIINFDSILRLCKYYTTKENDKDEV